MSSPTIGTSAPRPAENPRRSQLPPPPTNTRNGAPKMTVRRAVAARPRRNPARNCRPSMSVPTPCQPQRAGDHQRPCASSARSTRPPTASSTAARSAPSAMPTASRVRPTATTWAKNHVEPFSDVYQNTVPNAKKIVTAMRTDARTPSRPSIQNARPDVERAEDRRDALLVGHEPPQLRRTAGARARAAAGRAARPRRSARHPRRGRRPRR